MKTERSKYMKFNFNFNEFYDRNFGDFVHIHALREWFKGVPSLESFLKSKDDKAIVKDMHFTDERTTVDYIDTKDDTEKTETLCEYLTSDFFRLDDKNQFKKADHIRFKEYPNREKVITVRDKETGKFRDVIRSNCPIAYEATDDFMTSNKAVHIGIYDNGIKIYDDSYDKTSLLAKKDYQFCSKKSLSDCNPFSTITNQYNSETLNFQKTDFSATVVGDVVIGGQIMYTFDSTIWLKAKQQIRLMLTPGTMGASKFADTVYPKVVMTPDNSNVIITIMKMSSFPMTNSTPTYVTLYNPIENAVPIQSLHFTF